MIPITRRLTLLVTTAALVPLVVYGIVAWHTVGRATRASVVANHQAQVGRGAESVTLFLEGSRRLLKAAAANLQGTNLRPWQQEVILQNYLRDVPEFRELAAMVIGRAWLTHLINRFGRVDYNNMVGAADLREVPELAEALKASLAARTSLLVDRTAGQH